MKFQTALLTGVGSALLKVAAAKFDGNPNTKPSQALKNAIGEAAGDIFDQENVQSVLDNIDTSAIFGSKESEAEELLAKLIDIASEHYQETH